MNRDAKDRVLGLEASRHGMRLAFATSTPFWNSRGAREEKLCACKPNELRDVRPCCGRVLRPSLDPIIGLSGIFGRLVPALAIAVLAQHTGPEGLRHVSHQVGGILNAAGVD